MEKMIFTKFFLDVDLVKALIASYNLATKSFHRYNGSILCALDRTSLIEAFGLGGQMSVLIGIEDLQGKFERNKHHYYQGHSSPYFL